MKEEAVMENNLQIRKKESNKGNINFESYDFLPSAIAIQKEGFVIYTNTEFCELFNFNADCILGQPILKLLQMQDNIQIDEIENFSFVKNGIYKLINGKGSERLVEVNSKLKYLENLRYEFFTFRDITDETKKIQDISVQAEMYKDIFEQLPVSIYITIKGIIEKANKEGLRLLNEDTIDKIKGIGILKYSHPEDLDFIKKRTELLYDKKLAVNFNEHRLIRNDGELVTVESASFPFCLNGEQEGVVTTIKDITCRKQLEIELHESRELYKNLVNIFPDGICIHDADTFSFVSKSYANILGYNNPNDLVGQKLTKVISEEFLEIMNERFSSLMSTEEILPAIEYTFVTKDGNLIYGEVVSTRFWFQNKLTIMSTLRDITEKKKAEENRLLLEKAMEYDRLRDEFFSNISHELRTPLNILLSSLQLIELYMGQDDRTDIPSIRKYSGIMKQNCYRLLRLINNLLDITKIDSGFYSLNLCNYDIVKLVEDITQSVAEYVKEKNIEIIFDTNVEERVMGCDADKIERVILNLLSNSIKFTEPGGTIEVTLTELEEYLTISLKDTGIGIPEDKIESIFDRFIQVDKSLSRINEGSGIGLSLVKSFVEMHGGKIEVTSKYGEFTEFLVTLPLKMIEKKDQSFICNIVTDLDNKKIERMNIEFSDIYL